MLVKTLTTLRFFAALLMAAMLTLFTACEPEGIFPQIDEQAQTQALDLIGEAMGLDAESFQYETTDEMGEDARRRRPHRPHQRPRPNDCFRLVFPVTVNFPDSSSAVADSAQALRDLLRDWRQNHRPSDGRPKLALPYEVQLADSSIVSINGMEDLRAVVANCRPRGPRPPGGPKCYRLVFPVTVNFPDSSTQVADSARALKAIFRDWRMNNDSSEGRPMIAFPYDVKLRDGSIVTVNSREELRDLVGDCRDNDHPPIFGVPNCFRLRFPVILTYPDGTHARAANANALRHLLDNWQQSDAEGHPSLDFPYDVRLANGHSLTINNVREQRRLLTRCRDRRPRGPRPAGG